MNRILTIIILTFSLIAQVFGQRPDINLTFTCQATNIYKLDSIKVINVSQGGFTMLYYPDTILSLDYIDGITDIKNKSLEFRVLQNYPNPIKDKSTFDIYIPEKGIVSLRITDISGYQTITKEILLDEGLHSFDFTLSSGQIFFLTASWKNRRESIKILSFGNGTSLYNSLKYIGKKKIYLLQKNSKNSTEFPYNYGDTLLFIGSSKTNSEITGSDIIKDAPLVDKVYTFDITEGVPCADMPSINYMGHVYKTLQIGTQCWLKENLNVGLLIDSTHEMQDNGVIEKYCIKNSEDSCTKYGGLYQWNELFNHTVTNGPQGICPSGWHIPSDGEWKILEGSVDSEYGIGDPEWSDVGERGYDAGSHLKSKDDWANEGSGIDLYGFSGLPAGARTHDPVFFYFWGNHTFWWTSSYYMHYAYYHGIDGSSSQVGRGIQFMDHGFSVRCIKD